LSIGLLPPFLILDSLKVVALLLYSCQLFPVTLGQTQILKMSSFSIFLLMINVRDKKRKMKDKNYLTWIIHESKLPQMRGVKDEAVVFHRKSFATKQIR